MRSSSNIWNLISNYTNLYEGLDIGVRYTPTDRVLTTHYPIKGAYRAGLHLQLGRNVSSYRWVPFDAEAATSSMIILGNGSGSDREETSVVDDTLFPDDLILETVQSVSTDTPVEELDENNNTGFAALTIRVNRDLDGDGFDDSRHGGIDCDDVNSAVVVEVAERRSPARGDEWLYGAPRRRDRLEPALRPTSQEDGGLGEGVFGGPGSHRAIR